MSPSTRCSNSLATLGLALLAACGGGASGDPYEQGLEAAKKGDHPAAIVQYEKALGALTPDAPEYGEIKLAHVESLVQVEPEKAMVDFLETADQHPNVFEPNDSMRVFEWLFDAKKYQYAGTVAAEFKKSHPDSADLVARMDQRIQEAIDAGLIDQSQLKLLEGLGYVGSK